MNTKLQAAFLSGSAVKVIYDGVERLVRVERLDATRAIVKQLLPEAGYRSLSYDKLDMGEPLSQSESRFYNA